MTPPCLFISYSWSSQDHEIWVVNLATQLRESGIDVILDKWELKEGHDSVAFMEKMVTDPTIQKESRRAGRRCRHGNTDHLARGIRKAGPEQVCGRPP
jgi:TIR domain